MDTWITFVDLCRTSDRINLAEKTLTSLVGNTNLETDSEENPIRAPPPVIFAYYRLTWAKHNRDNEKGERVNSLNQLRLFTETLSNDIGVSGDGLARSALTDEKLFSEYKKLLAKCYVELGQWQTAMRGEEGIAADPGPILADYYTATQLDTDWYQAWHTWALANFEVITQLEVSDQGLQAIHFTTYIVPAVEGESGRQEDEADEQVSSDPFRSRRGMRSKTRFDCSRCGSSTDTSNGWQTPSRMGSRWSRWTSGWKLFLR